MSSIKEAVAFNRWLACMRPFLEAFPEQSFEPSVAALTESSSFITRRVQEDFEFWGRLTRCRTPQEVQQTYFEFWRTAWEQYQDYYLRLAGASRSEPVTQTPSAKPLPKYKAAA